MPDVLPATMTMAEFSSEPLLPIPPLRPPSHSTLTATNVVVSSTTRLAARSEITPRPPTRSAAVAATGGMSAGVAPPTRRRRHWSSVFRRSASSLAAEKKPVIATQTEFRRHFLRYQRDRVLRDAAGNCFKLHPIVMNGDCGFASIAKGINIAREHAYYSTRRRHSVANGAGAASMPLNLNLNGDTNAGSNGVSSGGGGGSNKLSWHSRRIFNSLFRTKRLLSAKDIRHAMYHEIRKARKTYLMELDTGVFSNDDFDKLERDVSRPGIAGHWLGTVLGLLEHVIIAHALNINIYLYQFDLQRQSVRQFECATVQGARVSVSLFFTGPPACGHFDTLVRVSDPKERTFVA